MSNTSHNAIAKTSTGQELGASDLSQFQQEWIAAGQHSQRTRQERARLMRYSPLSALATLVQSPFERHKVS